MSENQVFTVFALRESGEECLFNNDDIKWRGISLQKLVDNVATYSGCFSKTYLPIAWACGLASLSACAESIAAGRVIENVGGQWVARGVEEKDEPDELTLEELMAEFGMPTPVSVPFVFKGMGHLFNSNVHPANAAMIARDSKAFSSPIHISETGKASVKASDVLAQPKVQADLQAVKKLREAHPPIAGLARIAGSGHQIRPEFASADFAKALREERR